jgi:hypothetical protein
MSTTTPNLSLFKIIPQEDVKKVFNFHEILNENWDKIDLLPNDLNRLKQEMLVQLNEVTNKLLKVTDAIYRIGQPIIRLDNYINTDFEVRLEGGEELISKMPELYAVYGNTYGSASSGKFKLPDFRNRVFWGATNFGYIEPGLPDHRHEIAVYIARHGEGGNELEKGTWSNGDWDKTTINPKNYTLKASKDNSIYGKSSTVQPPSIKVRVVTRYR